MKKFLAMLLALCMIMGSIVIVSAEETEAEHPTESNKIRVDVEGFDGGEYAATPEGGSLVKTIGAGKHGVGDPQFSWNGKKNDNFDHANTTINNINTVINNIKNTKKPQSGPMLNKALPFLSESNNNVRRIRLQR